MFVKGELKDILNIYGDWLFERREFGQSALGTPSNRRRELGLLTKRSLLGRGAATEGLGCVRKSAFMARTI